MPGGGRALERVLAVAVGALLELSAQRAGGERLGVAVVIERQQPSLLGDEQEYEPHHHGDRAAVDLGAARGLRAARRGVRGPRGRASRSGARRRGGPGRRAGRRPPAGLPALSASSAASPCSSGSAKNRRAPSSVTNARSVIGSSSHSSARHVQIPVLSPCARPHERPALRHRSRAQAARSLARASSAARSSGLAAHASPDQGRSNAVPCGWRWTSRTAGVAVLGAVAHDVGGAQRHAVLGDAVRRVWLGRLRGGVAKPEQLVEDPPNPAFAEACVVAPLAVGDTEVGEVAVLPPGRRGGPSSSVGTVRNGPLVWTSESHSAWCSRSSFVRRRRGTGIYNRDSLGHEQRHRGREQPVCRIVVAAGDRRLLALDLVGDRVEPRAQRPQVLLDLRDDRRRRAPGR